MVITGDSILDFYGLSPHQQKIWVEQIYKIST